jgi:hypothetical protein
VKKPGCLIPGLWAGFAALVTLAAIAFVGIAAAGSESRGVRAAYLAALPLGLAWGGLIASLVMHLAFKKAGTGARIGGSLGCGCLGGIILLALALFFFTAIFPSL